MSCSFISTYVEWLWNRQRIIIYDRQWCGVRLRNDLYEELKTGQTREVETKSVSRFPCTTLGSIKLENRF